MNKRDHAGLSQLIFWLSVLWLVIFLGITGRMDYDDARGQEDLCQEMRALWESTNGDQGWPDC